MISVELLECPGIEQRPIVAIASASNPSWMDPFISFLADGSLLTNVKKAEKVQRRSFWFWLSEDKKLYRQSFGGSYLLCLHHNDVVGLLIELHEGICGSHSRGRSLSHQAMTQGSWWPNMKREAAEYVKKCDQCQKHNLNIHHSSGNLNPITSPWPFTQWGLDIIGPFPRATRNRRFVLVATNYFTKWVEVKALVNIQDVDVKKFVWKNIITRFGVPKALISDNGLQFDRKAFRKYCSILGNINRY